MKKLEITKGFLYGTYVMTEDGEKQTYGHKFQSKKVNGKFTLWYLLLIFMMANNNKGVTRKECQEFINTINHNMANSNHDLFFALKNCGILYWERHNKKVLWYMYEDKAKELINMAK